MEHIQHIHTATYLVTTWCVYSLLGLPKDFASPKSPIFRTPSASMRRLLGFKSYEQEHRVYFSLAEYVVKNIKRHHSTYTHPVQYPMRVQVIQTFECHYNICLDVALC